MTETNTDFMALTSLAKAVRSACLLEASAAKPGNVHPRAAFPDLTYEDFVRSADAAAPILANAGELGVGQTVFEAIAATRSVVQSNTNLGIALLIAPLAAVPTNVRLQDGIAEVLKALTCQDATWVYHAIRLAQPGGLGKVDEQDVSDEPTETLLQVMKMAADRDGVAAQYANEFAWVLNDGVSYLASVAADFDRYWEAAIIELQLRLLAEHCDTLILRKCGRATAEEASDRARICLRDVAKLPLKSVDRLSAVTEFDRWLRADGHRRNPGTTADLVAACLFAAFRDRVIEWDREMIAFPVP